MWKWRHKDVMCPRASGTVWGSNPGSLAAVSELLTSVFFRLFAINRFRRGGGQESSIANTNGVTQTILVASKENPSQIGLTPKRTCRAMC